VEELATNAIGSGGPIVSATTALIQPLAGGVGTLHVGHAHASGNTAMVPLRCSGSAGATCDLTATLSVTETIKNRHVIAVTATQNETRKSIRRTVVVGRVVMSLATGQRVTGHVGLSRTGKRLLTTHQKLKAKLTVTQPHRFVATRTVTFRANTTSKRRRHERR
jgi:hypothetical protein